MTLRTNAVNRTIVQTATMWGTWTTIEGAWAESASEGFCNDLGQAVIIYPFGNIKRQGSNVVSTYIEEAFAGRYVRIGEESATGTIIAADGTKFTAYWAGVCGESEIAINSEGTGYEQRVQCAGILTVLDQIVVRRNFGLAQDPADDPADIGVGVTFNMLGNRKTGNRSSSKKDWGGVSAYVFDLDGETSYEWTAYDICEYALAMAFFEAPGGPIFQLTGQVDAAAFVDKVNLDGCSCMEMINRMLSPKQGVGFRAAYNGSNTVLIDIMSLSKDAVTVTGGSNVPASDRQFTVSLTPSGVNTRFNIRESQSAAYDSVGVEIAAPQYAATFSLFDDFEQDWTSADEAAFNADDEDKGNRDQGGKKNVYLRYKLKSDWLGTTTNGFVVPTVRSTISNALHGDEGFTGEQEAGGSLPGGHTLKFMKGLPMPKGYDWTTAPTGTDLSRPDEEPIAIAKISAAWSGRAYMTLAQYLQVDDITIKIDEDGSAITFGPAKIAAQMKEWLDDSDDDIFITLGFESNMNTVCSWCRSTGSQPRDKRRIMTKRREKLRRRFLTPLTYLGCTDAGALKSAPGTLTTIEDDLPLAKSLMASMVPWYSESEWELSRTISGDINLPEDFVTGDMITEASFVDVNGDTVIIPAQCVITSIIRDYTGDGKVTFTTKRISIDVEAIS
jgi:hypothetical protein